jgi:hypothetical protein
MWDYVFSNIISETSVLLNNLSLPAILNVADETRHFDKRWHFSVGVR